MSEKTILAPPHIGNMLKNHFRKQRLRRGALARHLQKSYSTVYEYQKAESMRSHTLWQLCITIRHNFFADLAAQLPPDFTTNAPDPTLSLQERIALLEEENKLLTTKVETLMAVMGK